MCGRFTRHYTWEELFRLYHLSSTPANIQPSYNICPTDTVDTVRATEGKRELVPMRWGLIPWHWKKPLKEMNEALDLQRPRRDGRDQADVPQCLQAASMSDPSVRLL